MLRLEAESEQNPAESDRLLLVLPRFDWFCLDVYSIATYHRA